MSPRILAVLAAASTLGLAACSPAREPAPADPPAIVDDALEGRCDDKAAAAYIGRAASEETANAARQAAGARGVRVIRPGMAVTMDYRAGRLNLHLDDEGRITRITCG